VSPPALALRHANRAASGALVVVVALLALGAGLRAAGFTPLVDVSGSMAPAIDAGDVVLDRATAPADLARGQVATIPDPLSGRLITHRVVSVARQDGRVVVVTRGDANDAAERWVLAPDAPVRRVVARIPLAGRVVTSLADPRLRIALAALGAGLLALALLPATALGAGVLVLALAGGALGGTASDFTASTSNSGNSFAAAAVNTAPTVSAAVIDKAAGGVAGYIARSGTFYVYANATDDSGVSSVKATLTNVTGSSTPVTLSAGSFSAGGVSYGYRSALLTVSNSGNGATSFSVTATDAAGLTGSLGGSVTFDKNAPSASSIATTNHTGGTAGRAEQRDTAVVTFSEAIEPDSIVDGWDGSAMNVQAAVVDGGGSSDDLLRVYAESTPFNVASYLPLGTIDLGRSDFVTSGSYAVFGLASANGTPSTMTLSGSTLTIVLGSLDSGVSSTSSGNAIERYTPVATITDLAGNAISTSAISASGSHKAF